MPQQHRRFQADSLDEAYDQVRDSLGEDAVILATRRATAPGLYGRPPRTFVEVLAHAPEPAPALSIGAAILQGADHPLAPPFEHPLAGNGGVDAELLARASSDRSAAAGPALDPDPAEAVAQELAAASGVVGGQETEFEQLLGEIGEMRGIVEQLAVERVNDRIDQSAAPLRWLRNRLRDQGVRASLAASVLDQAADAQVTTTNPEALRRTVERQLATMLPPTVHLDLARRPAFVALVGPAGAGKTTFAMKLALEIERAYSLRVVVAGTDVERAGAPQQFTAVGAAAGVQTRLCYTPGELQALIAEGAADVVIVDTPGHDGSRRDRMSELQTFIHASRSREVLLVLPATMKTVDLERLGRAYAAVEPLGVVLTRCDDTASLGGALLGTGGERPGTDLHHARGQRLRSAACRGQPGTGAGDPDRRLGRRAAARAGSSGLRRLVADFVELEPGMRVLVPSPEGVMRATSAAP